jgi:hypothetical protein
MIQAGEVNVGNARGYGEDVREQPGSNEHLGDSVGHVMVVHYRICLMVFDIGKTSCAIDP